MGYQPKATNDVGDRTMLSRVSLSISTRRAGLSDEIDGSAQLLPYTDAKKCTSCASLARLDRAQCVRRHTGQTEPTADATFES